MSYTGITNKIIGITDNGLNTAAEMRSLLGEMSLEYFPYIDATKDTTTNYLMHSNVSNVTISGATGKVLVTKDYLEGNLGELQKIDEGNGIGYIIRGRDASKYGSVGAKAMDLSGYDDGGNGFDGSYGATGNYATAVGNDNISSAYASFAGGWYNRATATGAFAFGAENIVTGYGAMSMGVENTVSGNYGASFGRGNLVNNWYGYALGLDLWLGSVGTTAVGRANTTYTNDNGLNDPTKPVFIVGNGSITAGDNTASVRSDAFKILLSGEITAPSITNAIIDAEPTGKVLVTREYLSGATSGGTTNTFSGLTDTEPNYTGFLGYVPIVTTDTLDSSDNGERVTFYNPLRGYKASVTIDRTVTGTTTHTPSITNDAGKSKSINEYSVQVLGAVSGSPIDGYNWKDLNQLDGIEYLLDRAQSENGIQHIKITVTDPGIHGLITNDITVQMVYDLFDAPAGK